MNAVQPFYFDGHEVRTVLDERGEPWFVAKDVCRVLDLGNVTESARGLDEDERGFFRNPEQTPEGGNPNMLTISESGLYGLIFRSRKPEARAFRKWVTGTVLPAIRKTGRFMPGESVVVELPRRVRAMRPHIRVAVLSGAVQAAKMGNLGSDDIYFHLRTLFEIIAGPDQIEERLEGAQRAVRWERHFEDWAEECIEKSKGSVVGAQDLYESFLGYCKAQLGVEGPSQRRFGSWLGQRFYREKKHNVRYFGLRLRDIDG
ncbi:hypothetical protein G3N56_07810 [Desulfovibrio sulfodismutans]|uniref:Bro-N domain-containing protein n=1 Tax=Desulfolutivibrio sulfodismutans TaxID=63561 RepID=A0A7K3NKK7_9BACT|nr:BRO family protein [Desulfolutivibrio sulfodismutans]NDY56647.1 hypothetical protein [Desulfolutivibrio sulfodismutans]